MTIAATYEGLDFPARIERAVTRAMSPTLDLTHSERVALATLILRAEAKDGTKDFWVRRANFAELFHRVERTVTNWLNGLEEKGFIQKEQGRTRWGNFSCVTVNLTSKACSFLGLSEDSPPAVRKKISSGIKDNQEQSLQRNPASVDVSVETVDNSGKIPADCAPLLNLGITAPGIFKLMGYASQHKKRLGDIVRTRLTAISKATEKFGYLLTLARDGIDYSSYLPNDKQPQGRDSPEPSSSNIEDLQQSLMRCALQTSYLGNWVEPKPGLRFFLRLKTGVERYELGESGKWVFKYVVIGKQLQRLWDRILDDRLKIILPPAI